MKKLIASAVICLKIVSLSLGWGKVGHQVVAQIAENNLSSATLDMVDRILNYDVLDENGNFMLAADKHLKPIALIHRHMADVATWADDIKRSNCVSVDGTFKGVQTRNWHFIDLPISGNLSESTIDSFCENGDCIVGALNKFRAVLRDPDANLKLKNEALKFMIHLMGDIYQPLHCAEDKADHGGNLKTVTFEGRKMNLHTLIDHMVQKKDEGDYKAIAEELNNNGDNIYSHYIISDFSEIALNSHSLAKTEIYMFYYLRNGIFDKKDADNLKIVINSQLQLAGFNLAHELESDLSPQNINP